MTVRSNTSELSETLADAGNSAASSLKDHASDQLDDVKEAASDHIDAAARAADAAREELPQSAGLDPVLASVVDGLSGVAEHLSQQDIEGLLSEAGDFARRHPALSLGGAALVGFAAARFLKAGTPHRAAASHDDPWNGHLEQS
ncbi:hypothetical protein [Cognatishimia sp. F0-27]|uniref:hypothetical protein n=1 Tax=Cognatishimia sp. F0-27 TaxID=2816855 RepID=UPI001D0BFCBB|nr:hypothetical protein [Cognatishimia sp. F0-27]MCC1493884.1 hypothetical protein [Cognatishimia sp. F0-27]